MAEKPERRVAVSDNLVSVVVPNYNCGAYLEPCLNSLLQQTTRPAQIIVIDDGSQDHSRDVLNRFGDRIQWQGWDTNRGANAARNAGLQLAQSEWVVLADADAVYHDHYLATLLGTATAQDDVVYGPWRVIEAETGQSRNFAAAPYQAEQLWWENYISMCSLVRRSALPDTLRGESGIDDWILWLSMASAGARFRPVRSTSEPLFTAYQRPDGKSVRLRSQWRDYRSEVARQRRQHRGLIGLREPIPVVIPGRECLDLTHECLSHLALYSGLPLEVVYVDNGSQPATVLAIMERAEELGLMLTLVRNATNRQFTVAVNQGLRLAAGRHALCLNTDCFVGPDCVERLYWHLTRSGGKVAAVGPLTGDDGHQSLRLPRRRHHAGVSERLSFDYHDAVEGARVAHGPFRSRDEDILAFFCVFFHAEALAQHGLLDENESTFASGLGADDEWCWRLRRRGWAMKLVMDAYATHLGGQTFERLGIDREALQRRAIERIQQLTT